MQTFVIVVVFVMLFFVSCAGSLLSGYMKGRYGPTEKMRSHKDRNEALDAIETARILFRLPGNND